jgi:hypothetical protein
VIGAQKSATRWLRDNLGAHPDVFTARAELSQFDHEARWSLGLDFYRSQFAGWAGEPVVGESTPGYLMWWNRPAEVAERIDASLPGVRLIAVLREPVSRAQSALVHHIRAERLRPGVRLPEYVAATDPRTDRLGIVSGGWYASSLEPYLERFGDRLLVVLHDDVRDTPGAVYERAATHVGADPAFVPDDLEVVRNSRAQAKDSERTDAAAAPLDPGGREEVLAQFTAENARLEALIDRDLSAWSGG